MISLFCMNVNEMQMNENLKSQQLIKYLEYFSGVFNTGLLSHVFCLIYIQPKVKLGDVSALRLETGGRYF